MIRLRYRGGGVYEVYEGLNLLGRIRRRDGSRLMQDAREALHHTPDECPECGVKGRAEGDGGYACSGCGVAW